MVTIGFGSCRIWLQPSMAVSRIATAAEGAPAGSTRMAMVMPCAPPGLLALTSLVLAITLFGMMATSFDSVINWVARQFVSMTRPVRPVSSVTQLPG